MARAMLTDIFSERYRKTEFWDCLAEQESKLLMQCFRLLTEELYPPYTTEGLLHETNQLVWKRLHDQLSRELGVKELSCGWYSLRKDVHGVPEITMWTKDVVCEHFLCEKYTGSPPDLWMKDRLSLVELAFRSKGNDIEIENATLADRVAAAQLKLLGLRRAMPNHGGFSEGLTAWNAKINADFNASVNELNVRLQRANVPFNYHNGFLQIASDELTNTNIEKPFWKVTADPDWKNVDMDMKEALDLRDSGGRDPALYAAKALESAIKIISGKKRWTYGKENGAHAFIDNLSSAKSGAFIDAWEAASLKGFFTSVRNPHGHGPGASPMPGLSLAQTNWAIEFCMSWTNSLIARL